MIKFNPRGPERFAHQKKALRRVVETGGQCALLMDPGTGKTAVAIDYASLLALKAHRTVRVLVLAPVVALDSWVDQASVFASNSVDVWAEAVGGSIAQRAETLAARGPRANDPKSGLRRSIAWSGVDGQTGQITEARGVHARIAHWKRVTQTKRPAPGIVMEVMSLDSLSHKRQVTKSRTTTDVLIDAVSKFSPDLVIVDESHRLKSARSNVSRAAGRITRLCKRRLILTGTVMPHSPMDVWAQWRFLNPEAFYVPDNKGGRRSMPFGKFQERYGVFGGYMGQQVVGFQNLGEMQDVMAQNSIVVRKQDALDLPPVLDVPVPVHLSSAEQRAYDDMKDQLGTVLATGQFATVPNRLAQMMRLRQITSGYLPDDTGVTRTIGSSKLNAVCSVVGDTLAGEGRVVVFAHFRKEVADIATHLTARENRKTVIMQITGDTKPQERERLRKRFGSAENVRMIMVAQMRTMSLAVNELVTANHAVFASLSERRDDFVQARDRLNRIGQVGPSVTFWNVMVPGSVDEVIHRAHLDRESVEDACLRYIEKDA